MPKTKHELGQNDLRYLLNCPIKSLKQINAFYQEFKSRYWVTIGYPESMVPIYRIAGYCAQAGIRIAISPLHDKDETADHEMTDGEGNFYEVEYKKAHFHIMIAFGNTTTYSAVLRHVQAWGCVNCKPVSSVVAMYDYLTHKNEDPAVKHIYNDPDDVVMHINGFDLALYATDDKNYQMMQRIAVESIVNEYIRVITDLWSLIEFLKANKMFHELKVVYLDTRYFKEYIQGSRKHSKNRIASDQAIDEIMPAAEL